MIAFLDKVFLVIHFSPSSFWKYHVTPFWLIEFLLKSQLIVLWGLLCAQLVVFCCFKILSSTFDILFIVCLGIGTFGFILFETLPTFWTLMFIALVKLGEFSVIIFQVGLLPLYLSLLFLGSVSCKYWYTWHPRCHIF